MTAGGRCRGLGVSDAQRQGMPEGGQPVLPAPQPVSASRNWCGNAARAQRRLELLGGGGTHEIFSWKEACERDEKDRRALYEKIDELQRMLTRYTHAVVL